MDQTLEKVTQKTLWGWCLKFVSRSQDWGTNDAVVWPVSEPFYISYIYIYILNVVCFTHSFIRIPFLSTYLSICPSIYPPIDLPIYLPIHYPPIRLSLYPFYPIYPIDILSVLSAPYLSMF